MLLHFQKFLLLSLGLLTITFGCEFQQEKIITTDDTDSGTGESTNTHSQTTFEQNVLPILTENCALSGCHVENGPHDLDFRTYDSFIMGGDKGAVFRPGNAQDSQIIVEIVSGRMPPLGPPLPDADTQLIKDWINQQDPADFPNLRYDDDDDDDHDHDDDDHDDNDHDDVDDDHDD